MASIASRGLVGRFLGTTVATGAGFAWGRAAGPVLSPPLQALRNEVNERFAFVPLTPQQAAQASIVGAPLPEGYAKEAAKTGTNAKRFEALQALAGQALGFTYLLALRNRGRITDDQLERGLRQNMVKPEWIELAKSLRWQLPSGQELAQMAVQGVLEYDDAAALAVHVGTDGPTFDRLYRLSGDPIAPEQLLQLWNRRDLDEADVTRGLRQSRLKPEWVADFKKLRHVLPSVSDMVRFAVREVYDPGQRKALNLDAEFPDAFAADAARIGLDADAAGNFWAAHWDLPSYTQGVEMLHRGELTQAQFDGLLKALDYAPTWREKLKRIADRIPPISDMIRFAVREVYDPQQRKALGLDEGYPAAFTAEAALHGMDEDRARQYWAAHWKLPSARQGYDMLARGEITSDELDGLLKALDYPKLWRDRLANIAHLVPGRIDLRRMLAAGIITKAQAVEGYKRLRYTQADAEKLVQLAQTGPSTNVRELTAEQLTSEYEAGFLTEAEYVAELDELGFSAEDAGRYRKLADSRRVARSREQTLSTIRSAFVGHRLQEAEARAALDETSVTPEARDRIWSQWVEQRDANVRVLTPTQIRKLYSNADLTLDEALMELESRGFSRQSAERMLRL